MTSIWRRLRGGRSSSNDAVGLALHSLFAAYPPSPSYRDAAGHPAAVHTDADLTNFLERCDDRLRAIAEFLLAKGLDASPMLDAGSDGALAARAIDRWLDATLPRRAFSPITGDDDPNPPDKASRASDRAGVDLYFSFLADLGLLEGEAVRRRDPAFRWTINRFPEEADKRSFGRICLAKPGRADWAPMVFEMDEHMLAICHFKMAPRGNQSGHRFGELMEFAAAGRL